MAKYEAAETVLSPKGKGSAVIKRKNAEDKSPSVKNEDVVTVFSDKGGSSPETYKKAREYAAELQRETRGKAKGGKVYAKGGKVRGDGCAQRGKTKGRMV